MRYGNRAHCGNDRARRLHLALLSASLVVIVMTMALNRQPIYETLKRWMLDRQGVAKQKMAPLREGFAPH
jgi:hypothetical protein